MPRRLCYTGNCIPLQHTELVEYFKILTVCIATTASRSQVNTVGIVDKLSAGTKAVFQFEGNYEDQKLMKYNSLRVKLQTPFPIQSVPVAAYLLLLLLFFLFVQGCKFKIYCLQYLSITSSTVQELNFLRVCSRKST